MAAMEGVVPGFDDDALMNIALALSSQEVLSTRSGHRVLVECVYLCVCASAMVYVCSL